MRIFGFPIRVPFCKFEYRFRSNLPDPSYFEDLDSWMSENGADYITKSADRRVFSLDSSELLGSLSPGMARVSVRRNDQTRYFEFEVAFLSHKRIDEWFAALFAVIIVLGAIQDRDASMLLALPAALLIGHCHFYGMLPAKVRRIKRRLLFDIPPPKLLTCQEQSHQPE